MANPDAPPGLAEVRGLTVHHGHTVYPVVCRANLRVIEILHRQTGNKIPVPWNDILNAIGQSLGLTREEVLRSLGQDELIPEDPPVTIGLSAPSPSEDRDAFLSS